MTIRSDKNLYPGVNAHFNSFLQQDGGGWESFHAEHIIDLRRAISARLPAGYVTLSEKSLQISALPREEQTLVTIYDVRSGRIPGKPVTRIELLSPSNKPRGGDYATYLRHRVDALKAGVNLVEIDLLHEQPPIDRLLSSYADGDSMALPYLAIVSSAQPSPEQGRTIVYGAGVIDMLPSIIIPLKHNDQCVLDLNQVYQQTFASLSELAELVIDYAADPPNFDRYRPDDQARIRELLDGIRTEQRQREE
jgi:hypothetical protein